MSGVLVLSPTPREASALAGAGLPAIEVCGFGLVAAAARAGMLIAERRPRAVLLVGICGTFDPARLPVGAATSFDAVACDDIGAESDRGRLGPEELGLPMWSSADPGQVIHDRLPLQWGAGDGDHRLLSVGVASGCTATVERRRRRAEGPLAEDMEGFAVALAGALCRVPVAVVRGASNPVGERGGWQIDRALGAAAGLAKRVLARIEAETAQVGR